MTPHGKRRKRKVCYMGTLLLVGSDSVQYKSEKFVLFDSCFILFMIIVN